MRLNKYIADSGLCSRRKADELIEVGRVTVNRRVVSEFGFQINPEKDKVCVDGKPLFVATKLYLLFHKPTGIITTRSDEKGRKTIYDVLPEAFHSVDPAGRLDRESSGAIILSNDGDFLHQITHPSFHIPKIYRVTINRSIALKDQQALCSGVLLSPENKLAKVEKLVNESETVLKLTLITGYNRQIRRSLEQLGYQVKALKRLSIGPVTLGNLKPGTFRHLTKAEQNALLKAGLGNKH
jgi:pseudouridine synthase